MPNYAARSPPRPAQTPPPSADFGITATSAQLSLCRYPDKDNNTAERALRNSVIGRKNFYGSGARWAADLAADVWTITATAAQTGLEPLLPWTPQGRARPAVPAGTRHGPGP